MNKTMHPPQDETPLVPRLADGTPDWAALRREFGATQSTAYLDIARKALLPRCAAQAAADWFADIEGPAAGKLSFSMDKVEETRRAVGETFGAAPETLALVKNTSEAVNIVAQGFDWREGDNVVISVSEHENNTFPWRPLTRRGVELRIVAAGPDGQVSTDALCAAVDARTRILSIAWVAYGLGERADVDALAQLCREKGALFLVDGIQAIGVLNRRLDDLGAHVVASGGHKAQMSVAGAGLMYVAPEALDRFRPPFAAKYSFATFDRTDPEPELAPDAHRFEYGNPNFLGLAVQRRSARFIGAIGLGAIEARVHALTDRMIEEADRHGLGLRTPRPWNQRAGIVSFDLGGADADRMESLLAADGVRVASKDGHLRAAAHFYNNEDDVARLFERLAHHLEAGK
ncbi:aminotransferase class V-fold PLP-dependent enzyme [Ancylobacter mangrovi]|uniref:aminotransferase class V-fold PLP-dependent enzyme n=1 Tax=Ancylobacter mangrovi TaxID=2972472 RepID=UPI002161ECFB|nr:aminotransferase class V-fold PLP-dependent enzyme [Ancylobacter mangrovi]MCS0504607.1 aminotransferase class V-fold PLP-dependent enzyme [Ancylobacter mangrovi]